MSTNYEAHYNHCRHCDRSDSIELAHTYGGGPEDGRGLILRSHTRDPGEPPPTVLGNIRSWAARWCWLTNAPNVVTDDYGKELTAAEFIAMVEEITPAGKRHTFDTWPSEGTYLDP